MLFSRQRRAGSCHGPRCSQSVPGPNLAEDWGSHAPSAGHAWLSRDGSWLRVQIPDSESLGWVFANLVKVSGDVSTLTVIDPTQAQTQYTPMQAFYFKTGITQTGCEQAPQDGILIQTPKGAGQINLRANDVDVQLGSTAFFQAQPSGNMVVSVVEGEGHITAQGVTVAVPAGTQTTIPLDANLRASGAPTPAQPYDAALVAPLPIRVLPDPITIVAPLAEATPEATATVSGGSSGGSYQVSGQVTTGQVCAVDQPFAVKVSVPRESFDVNFTPTSATQGTWAYQYTISGSGETDIGSGTYTISAAANGILQLAMDGSVATKFNGVNASIPLHLQLTLTPTSTCGS